MNLYHIEGSKAKLWMTFVNDYMLFEYPKQPWVDCYKRSYYFQWTYPILRAPWPSYMNDVCKWLYAFLNVKNNLELTDTKGHIAFNEPIPYWGLHGLAIRMMFVNDYMVFWISKTTLRKKWPLNQVKIKNQIEGNIRNKNQSTTRVDLKVDLKNVFQHNPNPMKANFCP